MRFCKLKLGRCSVVLSSFSPSFLIWKGPTREWEKIKKNPKEETVEVQSRYLGLKCTTLDPIQLLLTWFPLQQELTRFNWEFFEWLSFSLLEFNWTKSICSKQKNKKLISSGHIFLGLFWSHNLIQWWYLQCMMVFMEGLLQKSFISGFLWAVI